MKEIIPKERIEQRIFLIRGQRVMIDRDLAELYGVSTKALNQAVKRNINRFPEGFMFQLAKAEKSELVTICDRFDTMKHSSALPLVFTEYGVAMLASILNSEKAVKISILIIKTFIKLREMVAAHKELSAKLIELESKVSKHDSEIHEIFQIVRKLLEPPKQARAIGFKS